MLLLLMDAGAMRSLVLAVAPKLPGAEWNGCVHCTGGGLAHLGEGTVNEENCLIVSPQSFISFK